MNNSNKKQEKKPLSEYLKSKMIAGEFDKLPGCFKTKNRMSYAMRSPGKITFKELQSISELSGITEVKLIEETGAGGDIITYNQLKELGFKLK